MFRKKKKKRKETASSSQPRKSNKKKSSIYEKLYSAGSQRNNRWNIKFIRIAVSRRLKIDDARRSIFLVRKLSNSRQYRVACFVSPSRPSRFVENRVASICKLNFYTLVDCSARAKLTYSVLRKYSNHLSWKICLNIFTCFT